MKKIPVSWLKDKGIELSGGDKWSTEDETIQATINISDIGSAFLACVSAKEIFITSFADRLNTGKQPVADWVPVVLKTDVGSLITGPAGGEDWNSDLFTIESWIIHFDALHEIYEKETAMKNPVHDPDQYSANQCSDEREMTKHSPDKIVISMAKELKPVCYAQTNDKPVFADENSDSYKIGSIGNILHNLSCSMSDENEQAEFGRYASDCWELSKRLNQSSVANQDKPMFTQAMADAKVPPPVGSEFRLDSYFGEKTTFLVLGIKTNGSLAFEVLDGKKVGHLDCARPDINFKPIDTRTDEEKLRDAMLFVTQGCDRNHSVINNLLASDKFTITLNKIGE